MHGNHKADVTTRAIAYVLRQWHENEPKPAQIIDFAAARQEHLRARASNRHGKPMPPRGGAAA